MEVFNLDEVCLEKLIESSFIAGSLRRNLRLPDSRYFRPGSSKWIGYERTHLMNSNHKFRRQTEDSHASPLPDTFYDTFKPVLYPYFDRHHNGQSPQHPHTAQPDYPRDT